MSEDNESHLVPGRECEGCNVCCIVLMIDDGHFKKPADKVCVNLMEKGGCEIYKQRPAVCQDWYCAWRFMGQLDETWRPDKSGILLQSDENGIIFQPIRSPKMVLTTDRVIELIAGGVAQGIPMSISIPTRKGFRSYSLPINDHLQEAVKSRSLVDIQAKIVELIDFASAKKTSFIPIVESE